MIDIPQGFALFPKLYEDILHQALGQVLIVDYGVSKPAQAGIAGMKDLVEGTFISSDKLGKKKIIQGLAGHRFKFDSAPNIGNQIDRSILRGYSSASTTGPLQGSACTTSLPGPAIPGMGYQVMPISRSSPGKRVR